MPPITRNQTVADMQRRLDLCKRDLHDAQSNLERARVKCENYREESYFLEQGQNRLREERDRLREQTKAASNKNSELLQQYNHLRNFRGASDAQAQQKDDEIKRLQEEIQRIQTKMNDLFSAVRNWALEVVRREKPVFDPSCQGTAEWLRKRIPGLQGDTTTEKMYTLIAVFAGAFQELVNAHWICGHASEGPMVLAKNLYNLIPGDSLAAQQKKAQWVLLTRELLQKEQIVDGSIEKQLLSLLTQGVQTVLGRLSSTLNTQVVVNHLRTAIEPHINIVQVLYQQEAEYFLRLDEAVDGDGPRKIDLKYMDEVHGEDEGQISACIFPMLIKKTFENDVKGESVIICKMKVLASS
ncbi:hypothetical protein KCU93_g3145, partial [Aureobasidium melanogenum]